MSAISPLSTWVSVLSTSLLFILVAVLDWYGHITERTALKCYLALTTGVVIYIALIAAWWAQLFAVPSAAIFIWALYTADKEEA